MFACLRNNLPGMYVCENSKSWRLSDDIFSRARFQHETKSLIECHICPENWNRLCDQCAKARPNKTALILNIVWFLVLQARRGDSHEMQSSTATGCFIQGG